MASTAKEKLRVLLPHWIEHSKSHQNEFSNWAEQVRKEGHADVAALIEQAMQSMQKTDALLEQALTMAGGAKEGHHHQH